MVAQNIASGCTDTLTQTAYITVNNSNNTSCTETVTLTPAGNINACANSVVTINAAITPSSGNYQYQWNLNGVAIPGAVQSTYQATQNGYYSLSVLDSVASNLPPCVVTSASTHITYNLPTSAPPVITASGSIGNCGNINATLVASTGYSGYLWNTGSTNDSITVTTGGYYTVTGQSASGCDATSLPFALNGSPVSTPPICMVTVDSVSNKHIIVWEKPITNTIDSFLVYKETAQYGVYAYVGARSYAALSEFTDLTSNAQVQADRYKIAVRDTCGGTSLPSDFVRSIHLQVSPGIGVARVLSWNQYEGTSQNIQRYYIYSSANAGATYSFKDSVNAPATFYVDNNPINGLNTYYKIESKLTNSCTSTRTVTRNRSRSNSTHNSLPGSPDGIKDISESAYFDIMPNPNNGHFTLIVDEKSKANGTISIMNTIGAEIYKINTSEIKGYNMDLSAYANGVYFIRFNTTNSFTVKRVVIAK